MRHPYIQSGQGTVEAIVAVSMVAVAILGSATAFKAIRGSEKSIQEKVRTTLAIAEPRALASRATAGLWQRLGNDRCETPKNAVEMLRKVAAEENVSLLDQSELEASLKGPLFDELKRFVSEKGAAAFRACSDAKALAEAKFKTIAESRFNQALCRCASARTVYPTLREPAQESASHDSVYACLRGSNAIGQSTLIEATAYATHVATGRRLKCSELKATDEAGLLERMDYTVNLDDPTSTPISGTFYLPVGGAR